MSGSLQRIGRIGTFEGRAGTRGRTGQLNLAAAMVELTVEGEHDDPETGERLVDLSVRADFPANEVEVSFELPEHGAERLRDALDPGAD